MIHHDNTGKIFWISLVVSILVSSIVSLIMILFVAPQLDGVVGGKSTNTKIEVPALTNINLDQARVIAGNKGLNIIVENKRESNTMPENYILTQDPLPGVPVNKGDVIKVTVSAGSTVKPKEPAEKEEITIPYMRGLTQAEAEDKIVSMGLVIGDITYRTSSTVSPGRVIQTDPPGGTNIIKGSAVNITVAKQESKVTVPRLYGKSIARARQLLANQGLTLGSINRVTDIDKPFDIIIGQSPAAGKKVKKGSSVSITVNSESY